MRRIKQLIRKYESLSVVLKASVWFVAVTIIDKGIAILTQPFINRILTTEEVGIYGVYTSWHSILSIIATFNLFCGVLEVYLTKNKKDKHNVTGSLELLSLMITLIVFCLVLIFISPVSDYLSLKPQYIIIMFLTIMGETMIQFWAVPKRFEYSYVVYSVITVGLFAVKTALSVFLTYVMVDDRILGRLIGLGLPTLLCGFVLFATALKKLDFKTITYYWLPSLKFNIPLIPHYLASVLLASSDKVMIEKLGTLSDVGLYTIAYTFSSLSLIVFNAINSAYNPYCMTALKEERYESLSKSTRAMIIFSIIFSLMMIYLAPEGLFILGGETYLKALPIVPVLIVGIYFSSFYFVFSNVEFVHEKTKMIFPITMVGATINIGLNYFLIQDFGYEAAAYTTFIGYVFIAGAHYYMSVRILKKDVFNIRFIVSCLLVFMGLAAFGLVLYKVHYFIRYIVILFLFLLCAYLFIKKKDVLTGKN